MQAAAMFASVVVSARGLHGEHGTSQNACLFKQRGRPQLLGVDYDAEVIKQRLSLGDGGVIQQARSHGAPS